jgi:hypothetical protein
MRVTLPESTLARAVGILRTTGEEDCRRSVCRLLLRLVKYPTPMGLVLLRLGAAGLIGEANLTVFLADLMRSSPDAHAVLLEQALERIAHAGRLSAVAFADLSSVIAYRREADERTHGFFMANVDNLAHAGEDLPAVISALRTFLVSDPAFVELFCKLNPLDWILSNAVAQESEI